MYFTILSLFGKFIAQTGSVQACSTLAYNDSSPVLAHAHNPRLPVG